MTFHIITLFPDAFSSYLAESLIARAQVSKKIKIKFYDPKNFENNKKKRIDDKPYGGGPGMVLRPEPVIKAIEKALGQCKKGKAKIIFLSPGGKQFTNKYADLVVKKYTDIVIISGRYEGIDARVKKIFKAEEISIGPFVLTGGELPAMIIIDAVARRLPGVLGNISSLEESRVASGDVYTRPETFVYKKRTYRVPKVLLSGNHKKIEIWRNKRSSSGKAA